MQLFWIIQDIKIGSLYLVPKIRSSTLCLDFCLMLLNLKFLLLKDLTPVNLYQLSNFKYSSIIKVFEFQNNMGPHIILSNQLLEVSSCYATMW